MAKKKYNKPDLYSQSKNMYYESEEEREMNLQQEEEEVNTVDELVHDLVGEDAVVEDAPVSGYVEETVADEKTRELLNKVVRAESEEEAALRSIITDAEDVDMEQWEKTYFGLKQKGNYFDLVRRMYPFSLPPELEEAQNRKERRYGWIAREEMEIKCDPSKPFFWTPVNRSNHQNLKSYHFNKHGGVYREGLYLCYMPWRMKEARDEMQRELAKGPMQSQKDRADKSNEYGDIYDPTKGGTQSAGEAYDERIGVVEAEDSFHQETYDSAGEPVA